MAQKHIQNEDIKELSDVGFDHSRLPSSSKVATLQFGNLKTLADILQERLIHGQPLQMHQSYPANTLLTIEPSEITTFEGKKSATPIKSQIPTVPLSTINFQSGATTGATFDLVFPTGVVGERVLLGLTLLTDGTIKGLFSAAYTLVRPNPGTLFVKGGLPLGFLELEWTNATPGRFKTVGALGNTIENAGIYLFGSGAGGGAGEGNANLFELELRSRLKDSVFGWVSTNIASTDEDTLVDDPNSTAVYDIANSVFSFVNVADVLQSIQMYGGSFLGTNANTLEQGFRDSVKVELHANWLVDDPLASYELSRDGGLNWLTIPMTRVGGSNYYNGVGEFPTPVVKEALIEYPTAVAANTVVLTDLVLKRAVKVTVTEKSKYIDFTLKYNKTGAPLGNLTLTWVKDDSGEPSEDVADILSSSALIPVSGLTAGPQTLVVSLQTILPPGVYWLVVSTDQAYRDSYVATTAELALQADSSGTYAGGNSYEFDGTNWVATANRQILFENDGFRYKLLAKITGGTAGATIEGFGIFFGEESGAQLIEDGEVPQYFEFDGTEDKTTFTVTNFQVIPGKVKVTFINMGLVFIRPFFDVQGNDIVFQAGTFLFPTSGKLYVKIENEGVGTGGVSTEVTELAQLMAANHLGSLNPGISRASPGRGIILQRPDGTLREVRLDDSDNIVIESLP